MKLSLILSLSLAFRASAQTGLGVPQAGLMVDHSGSLRAVAGIAQSFVIGKPLRTNVLAAACTRSWCLVKTESSLLASQDPDDPGTPAPPGAALFSLRQHSALIYFPAVNQFASFKDSKLQTLDWSVDGEVLALCADPAGPRFAVRRAEGVWIIAMDGSLQSALPAETLAVLLLDNLILYSLPGSVVLRHADGKERSFDVRGSTSLSELGESYVQASTAQATYVIRVDPGREQVSLLPDPVEIGPTP